jgi:alkylated DNA nucleotide flippase Atl1
MPTLKTDPFVKRLSLPKGKAFPAGDMLIASPDVVTSVVATVPRGRVLTQTDLRSALAARFFADYACPVTTGIFLGQAMRALGAAVPFHRVVRDDGSLNPKFVGGLDAQRRALESEGVEFDLRRKLPRVLELERLRWVPPKRKPTRVRVIQVT